MLTDKKAMLSKFPNLMNSGTVYCKDGEKLGKITSFGEDYFTVEKGIFFPKDFTLRYDDIFDVQADNLIISESSEEMKHWKNPAYSGWEKVEQVNVGEIQPIPTPEFQDRYQSIAEDSINVPVFEEELEASKKLHKSGQVTVRKVVHTELKHLTVPLVHEEVRVERVPVARTSSDSFNTSDSFQERSMSMPVMDEEVEITKRPVVREEVRLTKTRNIEEKDVSGEVRKEDVEIDDQTSRGPSKRKAG